MTRTAPRVSVGLPVYNGERYLAEALGSLLDQSYGDFELVIGDNGSTDATEEICRDFAARDPRIRYHRHPENLGAARNYNFVFEESRGELFRWAAHDDRAERDFLLRCVEALDASGPGVVLAYPRTRIIDDAGNRVRDYDERINWRGTSPEARLEDLVRDRWHSLLHLCSPVFGLIRRSVLSQTRLIQPFQGSDEALLIELALRGDFREVPEYLFVRRYHDKMSLRANLSAEERMAWFDPRRGGSFPLPRGRLTWGYLTAVARTPLPARTRLRCARVLLGWFFGDREWRVVGGELRIALERRLGIERPQQVAMGSWEKERRAPQAEKAERADP